MGIMDFVKKRKEKTLYFPGVFTGAEHPEHFKEYSEILNLLGVSYITLESTLDSGYLAYVTGHRKDAKKIAEGNLEVFRSRSVSKVICSSPEDYYMFKDIYPGLVRGWDIEAQFIMISILGALKKKGVSYMGGVDGREIVSYQDSCYLSRYCGIVSEPREIIYLLGGKIIEMENNRADVLCCGAGGGVYQNNIDLANAAAENLCNGIPEDAEKFICSSSLCFANLSAASGRANSFSSFVLGKLRGLRV
jgi:Fe-S oxidoreductase